VARAPEAAFEEAPGRLNGSGPVAVIDIGSNSVRLVVYERLSRSATPIFNEKELCGLGRGLASRGRLDPGPIASALTALRRFRALTDQMHVASVHVLATAAAREASNGGEFIASVEQIAGVPVSVLSGAEEARLSALGVISGIHEPDGIAGDLGGGSLEVVDIRKGDIGIGETFPLGGLRLEEASEKQLKKAEKIVADSLEKSKVLAKSDDRRPFYAIGGTWRSLKVMRPSKVVMSALGVREGLLYELLPPEEKAKDPLITACEELAFLRSRSPRHVAELVPWTGSVFAAIGLDETAEEARLRHAACLLADLGWRAHPEYRGEQSLNLISNAAFIGIDHPGRAYLALANFYRHEGLIDEQLSPRIRELATTRLMERARALGATLRVAYLISGAMPGVVGRTRIETRGKTLTLVMPQDLAPLGGARVERRLSQIAKLSGLTPAIVVE